MAIRHPADHDDEPRLDERAGNGNFHSTKYVKFRRDGHTGVGCTSCGAHVNDDRAKREHNASHGRDQAFVDEAEERYDMLCAELDELRTEQVKLTSQMTLMTGLLGPELARLMAARDASEMTRGEPPDPWN